MKTRNLLSLILAFSTLLVSNLYAESANLANRQELKIINSVLEALAEDLISKEPRYKYSCACEGWNENTGETWVGPEKKSEKDYTDIPCIHEGKKGYWDCEEINPSSKSVSLSDDTLRSLNN